MGWFDDVVNSVVNTVNNVVNSVENTVSSSVDSVSSWVSDSYSSISQNAGSTASTVSDWVSNSINNITGSSNSSAGDAYSNTSTSESSASNGGFSSITNTDWMVNSINDNIINGTDQAITGTAETAGITPPRKAYEPVQPSILSRIPIVGNLADSVGKGFDNLYNGLISIPEFLVFKFWDYAYSQGTKELSPSAGNFDSLLNSINPSYYAELKKNGVNMKRGSPLAMIAIAAIIMAAMKFMMPLGREAEHIANQFMPNEYPGVGDLVRMEIREVWRPEFRDKLLYQGVTKQYLKNMEIMGLNQAFAEDFWRAHWELPSLQQGFEMFHRLRSDKGDVRRPFTEEDIRTLLRIQDVLPDYHDQLIAIAYQPITRIDIRRMYQVGYLTTKDQLKSRYQDIGYSPADASALTDFTVIDVQTEKQAELILSIKDRYETGELTRTEASDILKTENVTAIDIESALRPVQKILEKREAARLKEEKKKELKRIPTLSKSEIKAAFVNGIIDADEFTKRLTALGIPEKDVAILYKQADSDRIRKSVKKG